MKLTENAEKVYEGLTGFPQLRDNLSRALHLLSLRDDILAIGVKGSLMKQTTDEYSDIDLVAFVGNDCDIEGIKSKINNEIKNNFDVITNFTATHIGMNNLLIFFLRSADEVVKIDIDVALLKDVIAKMDFLLLYSREENFAEHMDPVYSKYQPDFADLHAKFTGWMWYTYTKIKRGELLEAADSISVMRSYAAVPCILFAAGLPVEGYRFIEKRLDPALLDKLRMSHPFSLSPGNLLSALKNLVHVFKAVQPELQKQLKDDSYQRGNLHMMEELLEKAERRNTTM